jgi:NADH:ubiquinone oxidoreductase subunit F (NADH-binding)
MEKIKKYKTAGLLLDRLHIVQNTHGFIDEQSIELIADELNMSKAEVYGAATYYKDFIVQRNGIKNNNIKSNVILSENNRKASDNKLSAANGDVFSKTKFVFKRAGKVNPLSLDDYKNHHGFKGLENALSLINPIISSGGKPSVSSAVNTGSYKNTKIIIDILKSSGLKGRGGAGFPVGIKWETVLNANTGGMKEAEYNNTKCNINLNLNNIDNTENKANNDRKVHNDINHNIADINDSLLNEKETQEIWNRDAEYSEKYIVCNGDEGDEGAFADRLILEYDPFMLIEGILIAAVTICAEYGFIYIRSDYKNGIEKLQNAIDLCYKSNELGKNILNTGCNFDLKIIAGGGNYVCGEETALLESIENRRGMVRVRPPVPAVSGLYGKPTILNNVTTFASVAYIFGELNINLDLSGDLTGTADEEDGNQEENKYKYKDKEKDDKDIKFNDKQVLIKDKDIKFNDKPDLKYLDKLNVPKVPFPFQLSGAVKFSGLYELDNDISLKELLYDFGGGPLQDNMQFKAVQIGGPLGAFFPLYGGYAGEFLNIKLTYEDVAKKAGMLGHGGIVVYAEDADIKDILNKTLDFCIEESCGKCAPCRIGSVRLKELFERIFKSNRNDNIKNDNLNVIYEILETMKYLSLCGLGSGITLPIESLLKYFGDEIFI